jgi:hypothetical protein
MECMDVSTTWAWSVTAGTAITGMCYSIWLAVKNYGRSKKDNHQYDIEDPEFTLKLSKIDDLLGQCRVKCKADRAFVYCFHNGGNYLDNNPIKKFSVSHESCSPRLPRLGQNRQNVVITLFRKKLDYIRMDESKILNVSDIKDDNYLSNSEEMRVSAFAILPMRVDDIITSFIKLEWVVDGNPTPEDEKKFSEDFAAYRDKIQFAMASAVPTK